jgi:hypothetical protein
MQSSASQKKSLLRRCSKPDFDHLSHIRPANRNGVVSARFAVHWFRSPTTQREVARGVASAQCVPQGRESVRAIVMRPFR